MLEVVHANLPMDGRVWRVEWIGRILPHSSLPMTLEVEMAFRRLGNASFSLPISNVKFVRIGLGSICAVGAR